MTDAKLPRESNAWLDTRMSRTRLMIYIDVSGYPCTNSQTAYKKRAIKDARFKKDHENASDLAARRRQAKRFGDVATVNPARRVGKDQSADE